MARKSKSVYERIEDKLQNIKREEELLAQLNIELQELYAEKDDLEMRQLLEAMKEKGLTINEALAKMADESHGESKLKQRNKKAEKEIIDTTEE